MIRVLIFLGVIFVLVTAIAWLADRPGDMVVNFGSYRVQLSLMVAVLATFALAATGILIWWVGAGIWNSPRSIGRYFRARRRDRGYQALSTGLIAAGAGDSGSARRMHKQASSQLSADQEPLIHLLEAQTLMLEGRNDEARGRFEAMAADPETRLLGLRGLYLEARRLGEHEAARHYADEAAAAAPQLGWAASSAISARLLEEDYDGALRLVAGQANARQVSREDADHRRAVLLTAKAMSLLDSDATAARGAALEAHRLQPDFVPAAVIAGRAAFRHDELRKGSRILEQVWKVNPHPEIADAYVHARAGDSPQDRLARSRRLYNLRPDHVEAEMALARASLEAGELAAARRAAEAAIRLQPRESAYLLLADIEEAETGDQGRMREWLARAVRAPRDPTWTADGQVSSRWMPVSPVTGAIGAFEWRVPVERLGPVIEAEEEFAAETASEPRRLDAAPFQATEASKPAGRPDRPDDAPITPVATPVPAAAPEEVAAAAPAAVAEPPPVVAKPAPVAKKELEAETVKPPIPDDPGVDDDDQEAEADHRQGSFRLF